MPEIPATGAIPPTVKRPRVAVTTGDQDHKGVSHMAEYNSSPLTLGDVMITQNALTILDEAGVEPKQLLFRHAAGDWGDIDDESRAVNDLTAQMENRAASAYFVLGNVYVVVATQPEPNQTILGLPDEMRQLQGGDDG